jgi:succinate dehydrogenase / fumarate reductase, cytochrome b subunit
MLSMMMSITHRITGVALFFGTVLFVWWLTAAAHSDGYFNLVQSFFNHWFGRLILFGFTWAMIHHAIGGIRHFIWDVGKGFELKTVELMAKLNLAGSIILTVLLWVLAYGVKS